MPGPVKKELQNCSEQLKDYLLQACDIVNDTCNKKELPLDSTEAIEYTLKQIAISKKDKDKAMKVIEDYANDTRECKI